MASSYDYQNLLKYNTQGQNTHRSDLPEIVDGFYRNEAFAGIKPVKGMRQAATAAGHRRIKTIDNSVAP
jgi:hypothetical protein